MASEGKYTDVYDKLARTTGCVKDFKRTKQGKLQEISFTDKEGEVEWKDKRYDVKHLIETIREQDSWTEVRMRSFVKTDTGHTDAEDKEEPLGDVVAKDSAQTAKGCGYIILILAVLFGLFSLLDSGGDGADSTTTTNTGTSNAPNTPSLQTKYAHTTINIREGRGTNFDVATQMQRGDRVRVAPDSSRDGWTAVFSGRNHLGYVSEEILEDRPLPRVEVADWNWRSRPDFGTRGTIEYTVSLRNNTDQYIDQIRVNFESYDASGSIITSTFSYVTGIPPYGTSSTSSYATYYGTEQRARISIDRQSLNRALR
jgi:hypothetical protein